MTRYMQRKSPRARQAGTGQQPETAPDVRRYEPRDTDVTRCLAEIDLALDADPSLTAVPVSTTRKAAERS